MKIIILAAGKGSRLQSQEPKPLTQLDNGKTILEIQIENLTQYFHLSDIYVVIGFEKEKFCKRFPFLNYIVNDDFELENTSKSFLKALEKIGKEDLILINGDVLFQKNIIDRLKDQKVSTMVVNEGIVDIEAMKYCTNSEGKISDVSKALLEGRGEAIGINLFIKKDLSLLIKNLKKCDYSEYYEKAIEMSIEEGLHIFPLFIKTEDCIEIDFLEDLMKANQLLPIWNKT